MIKNSHCRGERLIRSLSQNSPPVKVVNTLAAVALVSSDPDLLEAAISELQTIPAQRVIAEDRESLVPLVLSTNALVEGHPDDAVKALETALHLSPLDFTTRNRLAKLLIADGKVDEAVALLTIDHSVYKTLSVDDKSELLRLRGAARLVAGDGEGMSDLMGAVRVCPWDVKGLEGVAWGRKVLSELGEAGEADQVDQANGAE